MKDYEKADLEYEISNLKEIDNRRLDRIVELGDTIFNLKFLCLFQTGIIVGLIVLNILL